jgi:ribosome biogenesis protein MAK21
MDTKISSKVIHLLAILLENHPMMKRIVAQSIERLLFRPNISDRACYYAVSFLNQIVLSKAEQDLANMLMTIYFKFFEQIVTKLNNSKKKRPEKFIKDKKLSKDQNKSAESNAIREIDAVNSKMMGGLLTGVNRAFPFCKLDHETFQKNLDVLFKISHIGSFNTSLQALQLIYQVQSNDNNASDRFFRALYDTLYDYRIYSSSKQAMYLNLLYKAMSADVQTVRVFSFVKRLLQCTQNAQIPFICGSLYMISEIFSQKPKLWSLVSKVGETTYDMKKRDPLYSNANTSSLWELIPLSMHFHPTISLYSKKLLSETLIGHTENYNPLQNHTFARFLDRFVDKAPKKVKSMYHGQSLMQPRESENALFSGGRKRNVYVEEEEGAPKQRLLTFAADEVVVSKVRNFIKV